MENPAEVPSSQASHDTLGSETQPTTDTEVQRHRKLARAAPARDPSQFEVDERLSGSYDENRNTTVCTRDMEHDRDQEVPQSDEGGHVISAVDKVIVYLSPPDMEDDFPGDQKGCDQPSGENGNVCHSGETAIICPYINVDSGVSVSSHENDDVLEDPTEPAPDREDNNNPKPRMSMDQTVRKRCNSKTPNKNAWARRSCSLPDILDVNNITADLSNVGDIFNSEQSISSVLSDGKIPLPGGSVDNLYLSRPLCGAVHSEEPWYICFKDRDVYCNACVEMHNFHCKEKVKYIPEIPPEMRQTFCQDTLSEMNCMKERFERVKADNDNNIATLQDLRKKYVRAVMKMKNTLLRIIEQIEREALLEMDVVFQEEQNKIENNLKRIDESLEVINDYLEQFKTTEQTEGNTLMHDLLKASKHVQSTEQTIRDVHKESSKVKFTFKTSDDLLKLTKEVERMWSIEKSEEFCCKYPAPCQCDKPYEHRTAVHEKEFSVRLAGWSFDREKCYITGCAFMPNGKLLICDNNNKKVKLFNRKYRCISVQSLHAMPWDVAVINEGMLVVTIPDKKLLQFIGIHNKRLSSKHSALLAENCWGVSYWDENLYVSCWSPNVVEILMVDLRGNPKRHIKCISDAPLHTPWYVLTHNDIIHVSDWGTFSIPSLTSSGVLVQKYRNRQLLGPLGMTSDPAGNIYVCARDSNNVHQLSADGKVQRVILSEKEGVHQPLSVSHSPADDRFAVTSWMSDKVHIYRLQ